MPEVYPSVAVVIPCHDYEAYVGAAIESALAQTRPFAQVVVVDDGSSDGSAAVADHYAPDVRVIRRVNGGQLSACLTGLAEVKADYVLFLDADDTVAPDLVETLEPLLVAEPVKVQFPLEAVDAGGAPTGSVFPTFPPGYTAEDMARDNATLGFYTCPPTSGNVYRRSLLADLDLASLDGRDFVDGTPVLVMPYLGPVVSLDRPLARYRVHGANHSQWGVPSPELLRGEVERFDRRWDEACRLLGRPRPPFGPRHPAFVLERELLSRAVQHRTVDPRTVVRLLSLWWASRLPQRQKAVLTVWALLLLVPSRRWAARLLRMRRAPGARPAVVRTVVRLLGVAGGRRADDTDAHRGATPAADRRGEARGTSAWSGVRSVVVAKHVPWPPNSGDKWRTLAVVRALAALGPVTVCAFEGPDEDAAPLRAEGIEVRAVPRRTSPLTLAEGLVRGRSITAARFWDRRLLREVRRACAQEPDVLVVEHVQLLPYRSGSPARTTVLDMHNIESSLTARFARTHRGVRRAVLGLEARALARLERTTGVETVAVVSETDRERLPDSARERDVVVVPNAWGEPEPLVPADRPVASFVALMSWAPNVDAAVWFTRDVWPLVTAEVPDARLQLVGRNPAPAVRALAEADPSVVVTGTVDDVRPYYASSRVALAPLLAGGGSRLKILEALAHARPVVATTIGVEGLEDLVGRGVVVADHAAEMARRVVELLRSPTTSAELGDRGVEAVRTEHGWDAATRPLIDHLTTVLERNR